jgi:hypothetical protein
MPKEMVINVMRRKNDAMKNGAGKLKNWIADKLLFKTRSTINIAISVYGID